jgi:hypothetical protein
MPRPSEPEITLSLPMQRVNEIMLVLSKQPFEQVAELISDIRNQAQEQIDALNSQQRGGGPTLVRDAPGGD